MAGEALCSPPCPPQPCERTFGNRPSRLFRTSSLHPSLQPQEAGPPFCGPSRGPQLHSWARRRHSLARAAPQCLMALSCPGRASRNTQVRPPPTALPGFQPSRPCHPGVPQLGSAISTHPSGALNAPRLSRLRAPADARSRAASVYSGPQCSPPRARRRECCLWW